MRSRHPCLRSAARSWSTSLQCLQYRRNVYQAERLLGHCEVRSAGCYRVGSYSSRAAIRLSGAGLTKSDRVKTVSEPSGYVMMGCATCFSTLQMPGGKTTRWKYWPCLHVQHRTFLIDKTPLSLARLPCPETVPAICLMLQERACKKVAREAAFTVVFHSDGLVVHLLSAPAVFAVLDNPSPAGRESSQRTRDSIREGLTDARPTPPPGPPPFASISTTTPRY